MIDEAVTTDRLHAILADCELLGSLAAACRAATCDEGREAHLYYIRQRVEALTGLCGLQPGGGSMLERLAQRLVAQRTIAAKAREAYDAAEREHEQWAPVAALLRAVVAAMGAVTERPMHDAVPPAWGAELVRTLRERRRTAAGVLERAKGGLVAADLARQEAYEHHVATATAVTDTAREMGRMLPIIDGSVRIRR